MQLADFHYDLPDELIAQKPLARRSASRLLCLDSRLGGLRDAQFDILPDLIQPGDLLVFNNTRVIPARLFGRKDSGGRVEVLVERIVSPTRLLCHLRASKSPKPGTRLVIGSVELEMRGRAGELFDLELLGTTVDALLEAEGHMPLPPYIRREDELADKERYQTVYGDRPGAVAAPTAGLHFDEAMLARLRDRGVDMGFVTLHVGAGTFQPVRTSNLDEHVMHSEYLEVTESLCEQVAATRRQGGRVVAVGTTSVRSLETAARSGQLAPYKGETQLFIRPGYRFKVVDALLTNFHLPESTLLMLVAAFAGYEPVMAAYRHAVAEGYRFFSYGDAMWLTRAVCGT